MAILGLVSTETYDATRFKNIRRSVQHQYPNGAAILTGLLSLMDEETTNDPQFSHWEKRLAQQKTTIIVKSGGTAVNAGADGSTLGATYTFLADNSTTYRCYVTDASFIRPGHVVLMRLDPASGTAGSDQLRGIVQSVSQSPAYFVFKVVAALGHATKTDVADNVAAVNTALVIGSAFAQGRSNVSGEVAYTPSEFYNYTQIFRTPFRLTGTALKTPLKYDESGPYKEKAKDHALSHMIELEKAMLFGTRAKLYTAADADPSAGTGLPTTFMGGILYYLERWEAGDYATVTATQDSDDDKRIITNSGGSIDEKTYDKYLERLFRVTNNTSNEKLCLCGSGFLLTLNQLYRSKTVLSANLPLKETYGMDIVKHTTPFGTVYYKTHPLFSQDSVMRYNGLFLDVRNLKYRPMVGRDTELLKNRQENDADYRKDEWFTEAGLEMWFPESCMYLQNVTSFTP